jgi:hypothetical protein
MILINSRKRLFFLLLLIPLISYTKNIEQSIINKARYLKLDDSFVWKNLLHVKKNKPSINHPSFLLSFPHFSLKNELKMTIESFFKTNIKNDNHAICKYPARYIWIKQQLNLTDNDFPKIECKSFNQYLKKTAAQSIQLIFVSENTSSPSSMMGHVFFKLSGKDIHNIQREHAVSFFTVIDTMNLPSLLVKSTITGMKGFFLLRPYQEQIKRYLKEENRNIWEYSLNLSEDEQRLIYFHFWELKDVKIKYLFTGFNCATIVHDMLSMTSVKFRKDNHLWITPKDVIKDAKKNDIINQVTLKASPQWHIKMLLDELKELNDSRIVEDIEFKQLNMLKDIKFSSNQKTMFLEKELLSAYLKYQYNNHEINESVVYRIENMSNSKTKILKETYRLDLSNYKDPLNTFDDTQMGLSYISKNNKNYFLFSFLPASNTLYDDNREYFGESDLRIMEFNLLINKNKLEVDSFNLYSMKSLLPWDNFTGGLSSSLNINYESQYDMKLGEFKAYNISAGIGYTKQYFNDIFMYSLLNVGVAYGQSKLYPYIYPEIGLLMYEVFNMKTILNYKYIYNQYGSHTGYHDIKFEQSLFLDKKIRFGAGINYKSILKEEQISYIFSLNYFF